MNRTLTLLTSAAALLGLTPGSAGAQTIVTDFSGWSESGNLLPAGSGNELEQDFNTSGPDITAAYNSHTSNPIGQEAFLTDEFATLTVGDRILVELDAFGSGVTHSLGLAVASAETPAVRENLFAWLFKSTGTAQLLTFDGASAYGTINDVVIAADTDTLFIEKSAIGWSFGGISTSEVVTYYLTNVTSAAGVDLTADGSAIGIWSDLRTVGGSSTLTNFTVQENDVTVIYADDFDPDTNPESPALAPGDSLNGSTPDTTTGGATWTAGATYAAGGGVGSGRSTATLPFTPVDGFIYTLDASVGSLTTTNDNWLALGFAYGESTLNSSNSRFISNNVNPAPTTIGDGSVTGVAWMFARGSGATLANTAFLGSDPTVSSGNAGIADGAAWSTAGTTFGGNLDMRIVLDTTGGTGNWTATWFADTGSGFVEVRGEEPLLTETINSVGFAVTDLGSGQINSFSLTSVPGGELPDIIDIAFDIDGNVVLTLDGPAAGLTAQRSDDLGGFIDVNSTISGNTLTIASSDVDPNADGADFFRIRN
ncbi:hypothetical protein [Haloferula sp. A504]|uniref:hypothetical protein n=1 Tax=Haloferula sp. A504 TaxID=3373601 RepID=UPI0031C74A61|nr:hypothetical protein [Verrucomicrobiaceae bacterium E54]